MLTDLLFSCVVAETTGCWCRENCSLFVCVFVQVLEQRGDGLWKGYVVQEGRMAKTGTFPANHVVLVDGQGQNKE